MSRFRNTATGVVVSVDDSKDDRFVNWESADEPAAKAPAKAETPAVEAPAPVKKAAAPAKKTAARKPTK